MRAAPIPTRSEIPTRGTDGGARLDTRYMALLGAEAWSRLPADVRARFSRKPLDGRAFVYAGQVRRARMSRAGWLLARAGRMIGGPLRLSSEAHLPCLVTVSETADGRGQTWTLLHLRPSGFPQVIHSDKRFARPTGLEEHVGRGFGFSLRLVAEPGGLIFLGERYFFELAGRRIWLPRWLAPGRLTVRHDSVDFRHFIFTLTLDHDRLGRLVEQVIAFEEVVR